MVFDISSMQLDKKRGKMKKKAKKGNTKKISKKIVPEKKDFGIIPILILIAIGLFVLFLTDYFSINAGFQNNVEKDKNVIADKLTKNSDISLINEDGSVRQENLQKLTSMSYYDIKSKLGIDSDFTLYFMDEDGNVVPINGKTCIGSPKAKVGGQPCG